METARVYGIDQESREVLRTFETGSDFTKVPALTRDASRLFASNWKGNAVTEIDLRSGTVVRNLPTLSTPRGLWVTPAADAVYVASYGAGGLGRLDLATGETNVLAEGRALQSLVVDEERGRMYVSDQAAHAILVHDLNDPSSGLTVLAETDPHPNTMILTPDGRLLLVSNRGENGPGGYLTVGRQRGSLLVIRRARRREILDAVAGGMQCTALDVSPGGTLVAFSDFRDDQIHVYRLPSFEVLAEGGGGRLARHAADLLDLDYPGKLDHYE